MESKTKYVALGIAGVLLLAVVVFTAGEVTGRLTAEQQDIVAAASHQVPFNFIKTYGSTYNFEDIYFVNATHGWVVGQRNGENDYGITSSINGVEYNVLETDLIMYTRDGGVTWTEASAGTHNEHDKISSISEVGVGEFYAIKEGFLGNAVLHTTDAGGTWNEAPSPVLGLIGGVFVNSTTGWVFNGAKIYVTSDGGANWTLQKEIPLADYGCDANSCNLRDAFFANETHGWMVGGGTNYAHQNVCWVWNTSDGGATWHDQNVNCLYGMDAVYFVSATHGWASGSSNLIVHTTDSGATWLNQSVPQDVGTITSIFFVDDTKGWATDYAGKILSTDDGGVTWEIQHDGAEHGVRNWQGLHAIHFVNATHGWVAGYGSMLRTTDGGQTWDYLILEPTESVIDAYAVGDNVWVIMDYGVILHSNNSGLIWEEQYRYGGYPSDTVTDHNDIFFLNETHGYAGGHSVYARLLGTTDGGETWGKVERDGLLSSFPYVFSVFVGEDYAFIGGRVKDANNGLMLRCNYSDWFELDCSDSWVGEGKNYVLDFSFTNATHGWAAWFNETASREGDVLLLKTTDAGTTWALQNQTLFSDIHRSRLDGAAGQKAKMSFFDAQNGFISVPYQGMRTTSDGGDTWSAIKRPRNTVSGSYMISANNGFAATSNMLYETNDSGETWTLIGAFSGSSNMRLYFSDAAHGWAYGWSNVFTFTGEVNVTTEQIVPPPEPTGNWTRLNTTTTVVAALKADRKNMIRLYGGDSVCNADEKFCIYARKDGCGKSGYIKIRLDIRHQGWFNNSVSSEQLGTCLDNCTYAIYVERVGGNFTGNETTCWVDLKAVDQSTGEFLSGGINVENETPPECKSYYWFDNNDDATRDLDGQKFYGDMCKSRRFCGIYPYEGLRTFETEAECKAARGGNVTVSNTIVSYYCKWEWPQKVTDKETGDVLYKCGTIGGTYRPWCNHKAGANNIAACCSIAPKVPVPSASGLHEDCYIFTGELAGKVVEEGFDGSTTDLNVATVTADVEIVATASLDELKTNETYIVALENFLEDINMSLSLAVKEAASDVEIKVTRLDEPPENVSTLGRITYTYLDFEVSNLENTNIENAEINFEVSASWLAEYNLTAAAIKLAHYEDGNWTMLDTTVLTEDNTTATFVAMVSGFSYFAITDGDVEEEEEAPISYEMPTYEVEEPEEEAGFGWWWILIVMLGMSAIGAGVASWYFFLGPGKE